MNRQNKSEQFTQSDVLAKNLQAKQEWFRELHERISNLDFDENQAAQELSLITVLMPKEVRMRSAQADKGEARLRLEGISMGMEAVSAYMEILSSRRYDVSLMSLTGEGDADVIFVFEIIWEAASDG